MFLIPAFLFVLYLQNVSSNNSSCGVSTSGGAPWRAAIYRVEGSDTRYICTGTIVSPRAILTGAVCTFNETTNKVVSAQNTLVAVGKVHVGWNVTDPNEQRPKIQDIFIRDTYIGINSRYQDDISVIILAEAIKLSAEVMPVCLDADLPHPLQSTDVGTMTSWGLNEEGDLNNTPKESKLKYIDNVACREVVPPLFAHFITYDKFCGKVENGSFVSLGDSGAGLTFLRMTNNKKEIHFLHGISSVKNTDSPLVAFTNVSVHSAWLIRVIKMFK